MTKLLYWNTGASEDETYACDICLEQDVDLLILAESRFTSANLVYKINQNITRIYFQISLNISRLKIFSRYPVSSVEISYEDRHAAILHLVPPIGKSLIVMAVHMPSKMHSSPEDQYHRARSLVREIIVAERKYKHSRTIVIGDFNINPFEPGMTAADGFQAVMDKKTALKKSRVFQASEYGFFYNPMWSRFGDESHGPPGTYQYANSSLHHLSWNMFDQVIMRPDVINFYKTENLKVLTKIGEKELLDNENIVRKISDHLPIVLGLENETAGELS